MYKRRTDLAMEAHELWRESAGETTRLEGVEARDTTREGFQVTTVKVLSEEGAAALDKPVGTYVTLVLDGLLRREDDAFPRAARALAAELRALLPAAPGEEVLVVGLGNRAITPDAVGPLAADHTLVTRHLVDGCPEHFGAFRPVSAIAAGVLASTGMESGRAGGRPGGKDPARLRHRHRRPGLPLPAPGVPHGAAGRHRHHPRLRGGQRRMALNGRAWGCRWWRWGCPRWWTRPRWR